MSSMCFGSDTVSACNDAVSTGFYYAGDLPAMTQMAIVAKNYGADSAYAATLSFLTVLLGIVVVPLYMVLVNMYI